MSYVNSMHDESNMNVEVVHIEHVQREDVNINLSEKYIMFNKYSNETEMQAAATKNT